MSSFETLGITDFDHIEFAVIDLEASLETYLKMGFEKVAEGEILTRKRRSFLLVQNQIKLVLSHSEDPEDYVSKYLSSHGEGVCNIAFLVTDVVPALEQVIKRGATLAKSPKAYKKDFGSIEQASIKAFGDVRHTFISREEALFAEGFDEPMAFAPISGAGLQRIDHITINVEQGQLNTWSDFYERVFGLVNTRVFDIHTDRTGLYSKVMQSPNGVVKMPFNEPTESESQIQEFLDIHHGPGVQHIALETQDIIPSLTHLLKESLSFLDVPNTYYDTLLKRVPKLEEDIDVLRNYGVLADGDESGYLLQIFSKPVVGPLFYEVIQRKGNDGFGEGNFQALFEAMEKDQFDRGRLK